MIKRHIKLITEKKRASGHRPRLRPAAPPRFRATASRRGLTLTSKGAGACGPVYSGRCGRAIHEMVEAGRMRARRFAD